jgi:hypothetical protein
MRGLWIDFVTGVARHAALLVAKPHNQQSTVGPEGTPGPQHFHVPVTQHESSSRELITTRALGGGLGRYAIPMMTVARHEVSAMAKPDLLQFAVGPEGTPGPPRTFTRPSRNASKV